MVVTTAVLPPQEALIHTQSSTNMIVNDHEIGTGTLYITELGVEWASDVAPRIVIEALNISVHAIQREPLHCIYMLVDCDLNLPGLPIEHSDAGDSNEESERITEIKFVPANEVSITAIYEALNKLLTLHPDPMDSQSEDEDYNNEGEQIDDEGEHIDDEADEDQFEDAEEGGEVTRRVGNMHISHGNGSSNGASGDAEEMDPDQFAD